MVQLTLHHPALPRGIARAPIQPWPRRWTHRQRVAFTGFAFLAELVVAVAVLSEVVR